MLRWPLADGEDCYVADVGQGAWEEVNLLERGGNSAWRVARGRHTARARVFDCGPNDNDTGPVINARQSLVYPASSKNPAERSLHHRDRGRTVTSAGPVPRRKQSVSKSR